MQAEKSAVLGEKLWFEQWREDQTWVWKQGAQGLPLNHGLPGPQQASSSLSSVK